MVYSDRTKLKIRNNFSKSRRCLRLTGRKFSRKPQQHQQQKQQQTTKRRGRKGAEGAGARASFRMSGLAPCILSVFGEGEGAGARGPETKWKATGDVILLASGSSRATSPKHFPISSFYGETSLRGAPQKSRGVCNLRKSRSETSEGIWLSSERRIRANPPLISGGCHATGFFIKREDRIVLYF